MHRLRAGLKVRLSGYVFTKKIVVMVVKTSDIYVEFFAEDTAVAQLIAVQLFWRKVGVGVEARERRRAVGRCANVAQEIEIFLRIGRSAQGVRESCPDGLVFARCPE